MLQAQFRALRAHVEHNYNTKITSDMNIWAWLVKYACFTVEIAHVKINNRTAYQELNMRSYSGVLVPFGETVVFRHPHSKVGRKPGLRIRKGDLRNELGLFVGKSIDTDESYVMTLEGTVTTRTIRRLPVEQQNSLDLLVHGAGVPWNTKLGQKPSIVP